MQRRTFLAAATSVGIAAVAGCSSAIGEVPAPNVPDEQLDGYERIDQQRETVFEEEFPGGVEVAAQAHTVVYEDAELSAELDDRTLGMVHGPLSTFFATRIVFSPSLDDLPGGIGRDQLVEEVRENAEQDFRRQMNGYGVEDVEKSDESTMTTDSGVETALTAFSGSFGFDGVSFPVTDDRTVEIAADEIEVRGWLSVWHDGEYTLVAGGAHPAENFAETTTESLSDGIDVTVDIDMQLEPDSYRERVHELMQAVQ